MACETEGQNLYSVGRQIQFTQIYPGTHPDFSVGIPIWAVPKSWVPTRADGLGYPGTQIYVTWSLRLSILYSEVF
jgi:hypothetical protein